MTQSLNLGTQRCGLSGRRRGVAVPRAFLVPKLLNFLGSGLLPSPLSLAHLKYFVKGRVESVLLNFGLSLAALGLVGQQVHFDVAGKKEGNIYMTKHSLFHIHSFVHT